MKRSKEISALNRQGPGALLLTEDETHDKKEPIIKNELGTFKKENYLPTAPKYERSRTNSADSDYKPDLRSQISPPLETASKIIRSVETLKGKDDVGVEDFIQSVKKAKNRCSQPDLLLDFIKIEKIQDIAKRAIQFSDIDTYEKLFDELRKNLSHMISVTVSRQKLNELRQRNESISIYNTRFRQYLNELRYAIQSEHSNAFERKILINDAEKTAIVTYIDSLKFELASIVRAKNPDSIKMAQTEALLAETWIASFKQKDAIRTGTNIKQEFKPFRKSDHRPQFFEKKPFNVAHKSTFGPSTAKFQTENANAERNQNNPSKHQNFQNGFQRHRPPPPRVNFLDETHENEETQVQSETEFQLSQDIYYQSDSEPEKSEEDVEC